MNKKAEAVEFAGTFMTDGFLFEEFRSAYPTPKEMLRMGEALEQAVHDPDTNDFDTLVLVAAAALRDKKGMPGWLASFAADVLEGKRKRPTKRGADKYKNWQRDYSLWRAVDEVASKFNLAKYTNNELSNKPTAAGIVAEAAGLNVDVVITAYKAFSKRGNNTQNTTPR